MKRNILLLIALTIGFMQANAQQDSTQSNYYCDDFSVGIIGGLSTCNMEFDNTTLSNYQHDKAIFLRYGFFFDIRLVEGFSIRPEIIFARRTLTLMPKSGSGEMFLLANHMDTRFNFAYTFRRDKAMQPYLTLSPAWVVTRNGKYRPTSNGSTYADLTADDFGKSEFDIFFGGGFRFKMPMSPTYAMDLMAEAGYCLPLTKSNFQNSGFEFNLRLGFPLCRSVIVQKHRTKRYVDNDDYEDDNDEEGFITVYDGDEEINPVRKEADDVADGSRSGDTIETPAAPVTSAFDTITPASFYFGFDSDKVNPGDVAAIDDVVALLKRIPNLKVFIVGHSDNTHMESDNWQLSSDRAKAVADMFIERGIAPERIIYVGVGSYKSVAPNDTDENRARNRRVDIW